jgi:curved DNA-binding protein
MEAALGATVTIPTLDGRVTLRVPPGTNTGQQLRVRGRGMPRGNSSERGDLFVVPTIQVPSSLTDEERKLWEQLGRTSGFRPRQDRH